MAFVCRQLLFDNFSILHHEHYVFHGCNVLGWVSRDSNYVSELAWFNRTDFVGQPEQFCGVNCRRLKGLDRCQAAPYHRRKLLWQEVRLIVEAKGNFYMMLEGT